MNQPTRTAVRPAGLDMPRVRRPDVVSVHVSHWYVPDRERGLADLHDLVAQWTTTPWPEEVLSFSCFLGTDDDTVLTYTQCAEPGAYRRMLDALGGVARAEAVEYRPHRSVVLDSTATPGCVIVAMFDVDGPDRQELIVEAVADTVADPAGRRDPGLLSANFHVSRDGTRVLNYAEWTSDEAHRAFLAGATHTTTRRVSDDTPGVRPIGFKRYHLHRSIGV
ncbi:antibiotic biosynthesis monooxygenase family protein [Streptomyces sp. NPDC002680]|uniref:antibiotic biosynthesis monooxygenase family protein n=1 Tax=Streptomyces sp. NPDC002680 TaxID=3364659 RepID=UPI0036C48475